MKRFTMPVAVHLLLIQGDEILLLRRYNTGYEDGNYSVIAGHVDQGEDFISAMIREAKEEAGILIRADQIKPVQVMHRHKDDEERIDYFLTAEIWEGQVVNCEPDKCDDLKWFKLKALPYNMVPYVRFGIQSYIEGEVFTRFGWPEASTVNKLGG